jgi:hypothetical protein
MLHHGVGAGSAQGLLERLASNAPFSRRLLFPSRTSRAGERHCGSPSRTVRSSKSGAKAEFGKLDPPPSDKDVLQEGLKLDFAIHDFELGTGVPID